MVVNKILEKSPKIQNYFRRGEEEKLVRASKVDIPKRFYAAVVGAMQKNGVSQPEVCHAAGISTATLALRRKTPSSFRLDEMISIADSVGVPLANLLDGRVE